jgi:hypothetical protein
VSAVEVLRLTSEDFRLLARRFAQYGNSHRRMEAALAAAAGATDPQASPTGAADAARCGGGGDAAGSSEGAPDPLARLRALRLLERRCSIDLGSLCHRFQRREDPALHPLERSILESIACWRPGAPGAPGAEDELWVFLDRVQKLRQFIDEEYTEWLEPAQG